MQIFQKVLSGVYGIALCALLLLLPPSIQKEGLSAAAAERTGKPAVPSAVLERRIHELINSERKENGLAPLKWDEKLSGIARKHGRDMAARRYFSHTNHKGEDPTARGLREGFRCAKRKGAFRLEGLAENLFQSTLYTSITYRNGVPAYAWSSWEEIAHSAVQGWMGSPGHRRNILNPDYDREGIGVFLSGKDNRIYIVEMFC